MITLTINSTTLTSEEAGAAAAFLLALHPNALADAIATLTDADQLRLPFASGDVRTEQALERGTPDQSPVDAATVFASAPAPAVTAAEAFAPAGAQPPEAGAPFVHAAPATAPAASEPISPAGATSAAAPAGVTLDSEGLPWDKRIHSDPPTLTKKGPWRAKRGLNQLIEHQVKAELRAALAAPGAGTAAPAPAPAPVETPEQRTAREAVEQGLVAAPVAPPPPATPAAPAPAAPPAPAATADDATPPATLFAAAMRKVTAAQLAGHITVPETDAVLTHLGLAQMRDLFARPDLIPVFDASVDNHVARFVTAGA